MNKKNVFLAFLTLLCGCYRADQYQETITSMQLLDRNGFSETISNSDRLKPYQNVDFFTSQPYEKVLRVYRKDENGKNHSKITSYHSNGGIYQYLEALDGRANGRYLQWHLNGTIHIEAHIIEGLADLGDRAKASWLFDGTSSIWDKEGNRQALIAYDKGLLVQTSTYYHPNGTIAKEVPYQEDLLHGVVLSFDTEGNCVSEASYVEGIAHGKGYGLWKDNKQTQYEEIYHKGKLMSGQYFDPEGSLLTTIEDGNGQRATFDKGHLAQTTQYQDGVVCGEVATFDFSGQIKERSHIQNGLKSGEEWIYYTQANGEPSPQMMLTWHEGKIQGMTKTYYPDGKIESQREMCNNKKHGLSLGYYTTGDVMLIEEYDMDKLKSGQYFALGKKDPISTVEDGNGLVTLYDHTGNFRSKIKYEKGKPLVN